MITITITFKNDLSIGFFSELYTMQIPDFRTNWTETGEMLNNYIEEKRQEIRELYNEFQGENDCRVMFQWEEEALMSIEEECDEERRTFEQLEESHDDNIENNILSQDEMSGWENEITYQQMTKEEEEKYNYNSELESDY